MKKSEAHGWAFVSEDRIVHGGPLHLVRVIFHSNDDKDELKAYDGLSTTGRQVFTIQGDHEKSESYEIGAELRTGLYVTLTADCHVTVIFDPLGDE